MGANRNDPFVKAKRAQALKQGEHAGQARARRRAAMRARFAAAEAAAEAASRRAERDAERAAEKAAYEAEKSARLAEQHANTARPMTAPAARPVISARLKRDVPACGAPGCDSPARARPRIGPDGRPQYFRLCSLHVPAGRMRY